MESFSNIAFSPLLLSWLTKSCSSVWASTKQRMELAQEGQLWMQRHCGSVCELCCPDWRAQWNDAVNFGACNLVFTVLVRLGGWSVWGVWASPQLWGVSLGPPVWRWQMSKEPVGAFYHLSSSDCTCVGVQWYKLWFCYLCVFLFQGWWEGCSASSQGQEESWTASCVHPSPETEVHLFHPWNVLKLDVRAPANHFHPY